jgi:hypothetical protein
VLKAARLEAGEVCGGVPGGIEERKTIPKVTHHVLGMVFHSIIRLVDSSIDLFQSK